MRYTFIYTVMIASLVSCSSEKKNNDDEKLQKIHLEDAMDVTVDVVRNAPFYNEIVSNGRVVAGSYADVYWNVDGTISSVATSNGKYINKGDIIAQVESYRPHNNLESAKADMESSRLAMLETIIGQGYDPESDTIPDNVRHLAEIKSGYMRAKAAYQTALFEYDNCTLKAPISGIVANLSDKASNKANQSTPFCRIIDTSSLTAEFSVIENELPMIKEGQPVEISAFAIPEKRWSGVITEVNPFIESNGMIKVKARIANPSSLYEGTNISIRIRQDVGVHLSVPKGAIAMRSDRPVVFKAVMGKAKWCYVDTSIENSELIAITGKDIQEGDTVVVSGNTFLAHDSKINY